MVRTLGFHPDNVGSNPASIVKVRDIISNKKN